MSSNYAPTDQQGSFAINTVIGLLLTAALFAILPLMHYLGEMTSAGPNISADTAVIQPPPPPPDEPPPPPERQKELEQPEMKEPPPPMTLSQLEMALNPGVGNAAGDFGFGDFNDDIDALDGMQIFDLGDVDKRPSAISMTAPQYPYNLQKQKIKGRAVVEFVLDAKGRPQRVRVVSSTHHEFDQPAIDCITRSIWDPARKDGKAVNVRVRQPVEFKP